MGYFGVFDAESLQKFWKQHRTLLLLQHSEQDLKRHFLEVRLYMLHFLQQEIVCGKRHSLDLLGEAHVRMQAVECLVLGDEVAVLDHLL